ncbi:MAG: membrane protein insertase YidC [Desulfovibrionaceae bacterium]
METKRVIIAVALSLLVLIGWNYLFPAPPAVDNPAQTQNQTAEPQAQAELEKSVAPAVAPAFVPTAGRSVHVKTSRYDAQFNTVGAVLEHFRLLAYKKSMEPDSPPVDLVSSDALAMAPMGVLLNGVGTWRNPNWSFEGNDLTLAPGETGTLTFVGDIDGLRLARELTFSGDSYVIEEKVRLLGATTAQAAGSSIGFTLAASSFTSEEDKYNPTAIAYFTGDKVSSEADRDDLAKGITSEAGLKWAGVESNYFLLGLAPLGLDLSLKAKFEGDVFRVAMQKTGMVDESGQPSVAVAYYFGPKLDKEMALAPNDIAASATYGWFDFVSKPLMTALRFFQHYVGNWGVAIILLTVLIKIIFLPLSHKSYKSMEQMKKLQPMMQKLREKYKDDRERMNQEVMSLYKTYKVNPAGGCLPMVVQIPVFIGLYQALLKAIELRHAPFIVHVPFTDMIWLADLSAKDPYYVTPLIMGATMFLQQKLTPTPGDPTQAKIMMLMPLVFTFMFLNFPSGLVVYWLVNNVLSIAQQWWMLRNK